MSKPIKETQILTGRDAVNFYDQKAVDEKFKKKRPALSPTPLLPEAQPLEGVKFTHPFRVGRKQNRAALDANGLEVVVFKDGLQDMAMNYCNMLNAQFATDTGGGKAFAQRVYEICSKRSMPTEGEIQSLEIEAFNILGATAPSTHSSSEMVEGESTSKSIEQLLVDLQDKIHYQTYPSDNQVPISKIENLQGDYFPLHMVKEVAEQYANQFKNK